jgi:hypothetical protein
VERDRSSILRGDAASVKLRLDAQAATVSLSLERQGQFGVRRYPNPAVQDFAQFELPFVLALHPGEVAMDILGRAKVVQSSGAGAAGQDGGRRGQARDMSANRVSELFWRTGVGTSK